jgi:hypothetical protein
MAGQGELATIFDAAAARPADAHREQLAYRHMIALADAFEGWSMDQRTLPEQSASLLGFAEALRRLAFEVGESWSPPEPTRLTLIGFMGRKLLDEPTPGTPRDLRNKVNR